MKQGFTDLNALAAEVTRQNGAKRDFIADSRKILMAPDTGRLEVDLTAPGADLQRVEDFAIRPHAHKQLATYTGIPLKYYERMPTDLKAINVNHWLRNEPSQRMLRTIDGEARALVSDSYRPLDNYDLLTAVLPVLMDITGMRVESSAITETKMYLKCVFPTIEADLDPKVGDIVNAGMTLSNSEVGAGSLEFLLMLFRLWCLNGCTSAVGHKRRHVGKRQGEADLAEEFYTNETKAADDAAFWMKVQDTAKAIVTEEHFTKMVDDLRRTKERELGNPVEVVELAANRFGFNETEQGGILQHLTTGGDLTGYGLLNAVTRYSQDVDDYDRASELEKVGGQIIELPDSAWRELAPVVRTPESGLETLIQGAA